MKYRRHVKPSFLRRLNSWWIGLNDGGDEITIDTDKKMMLIQHHVWPK